MCCVNIAYIVCDNLCARVLNGESAVTLMENVHPKIISDEIKQQKTSRISCVTHYLIIVLE